MVGRARLLASSGLALLFFAIAPTAAFASSSGPACGHANANNPGHHHGLIKNGCWPDPAPTPAPKPVPSPLPVPKLPPSAVTPPGHFSVATPPAVKPAVVLLPAVATPPVAAAIPELPRANQPSAASTHDPNVWVVTALLPTLLVILVLLAGRAALGRRRLPATLPA